MLKKLLIAVVVQVLFATGGAFADTSPTPMPKASSAKEWKVTPEQRENLAKLHEKMAACLRSNKPMKECHEEMRKLYEAMGEAGCPIMGHKQCKRHCKTHDKSSE